MRHLRTLGFTAVAAILLLAATGTAKAQRVNYGSQTSGNVSVFYFDLPPSTQLIFLNQVNGAEISAGVPAVSGTGSLSVPFGVLPPGPGQYYVLARQSGLWVARTVLFYVFI